MWSSIYQEDTNFNNPQLWSNKTNKKEAKNTWKVDVPKPKKDNDVENSKLTKHMKVKMKLKVKKNLIFQMIYYLIYHIIYQIKNL